LRLYWLKTTRSLSRLLLLRQSNNVGLAEAHFRQAFALAQELGMRPLMAYRHRGPSILYLNLGRGAQAHSEMSTAIALYRTMEMTFWLPPDGGGAGADGGALMDFDELLAKILHLLQQEKRLSYRALKRRFALDDEYLEDIKAEIIQAKQVARDEDGAVLVWTGSADTLTAPPSQPAPAARSGRSARGRAGLSRHLRQGDCAL
jgi:hypothetical protein